MKKILTGSLALLLSLFLLFSAAAAESADLFPDFTLTDQYGNTHTLSEYQGKYVFLNFWATWCPPCKAEMPDFEELYHAMGENEADLIILGICAPGTPHEDSEIRTAKDVLPVLEELGVTYPVLMDTDAALFDEYITVGYPTSLFIDPEGRLIDTAVGMIDTESLLGVFGLEQ